MFSLAVFTSNPLLVVLLLLVVVAVLKLRRKPALSVDEKALGQTEVPSKPFRPSPIPATETEPPATMPSLVTALDPGAAKQTYDAFLVLDVEGTCQPGTDFNYANEIIASHPVIFFVSWVFVS